MAQHSTATFYEPIHEHFQCGLCIKRSYTQVRGSLSEHPVKRLNKNLEPHGKTTTENPPRLPRHPKTVPFIHRIRPAQEAKKKKEELQEKGVSMK